MKALETYRKASGLTQSQLGKRLGVSQATVSDIINGVHSPSIPLLKRIAKETGVSLDELLSDASPHAAA
jgi:transcriptional regulator with XRE-family HTH domain